MTKEEAIKLFSEFPRNDWVHYFKQKDKDKNGRCEGINMRYAIIDMIGDLFVEIINLGSIDEAVRQGFDQCESMDNATLYTSLAHKDSLFYRYTNEMVFGNGDRHGTYDYNEAREYLSKEFKGMNKFLKKYDKRMYKKNKSVKSGG